MKKILSTISVVFCVISAKSQLNFIQDFENIQTVLQQFGVVNLVKSDQYEICNVTSLAIRESGYGSLISNPSTITFKKNFELLAGKDVYLSFKYRSSISILILFITLSSDSYLDLSSSIL